MKISLIYPLLSKERSRVDENKQYWPPLGLAYIAAVLKKEGHKVQILDRDYILRKHGFDFKKTDEYTLRRIKEFETEIVGFSATTPNISDVNWFSKMVKDINSRIITVIGGPHCIGEPEDTLEICGGIDMLVRGEGEMAMLDIARGITAKDIAGLSYRSQGKTIISNQDRPLIESLDDLPFPARHLLDMAYYTRPSRFISRNLSLRTTHIFTARGCPYNCYYCAGPLMGRRRVRYHSPQRVFLEIAELIGRYSVEAIYFADDMFLSNKERAREIMDLFIQYGINKKIVWMAQVNPKAVDTELLSNMKKAGCVHVEYGFESGSQRILNLMNKNTDVEQNKNIAAFTKKSGLRFQGNFIVGYPGETEEDFDKTVSFIKETRPNNISLNLFMPLPGTQIYKRLKEEGRPVSNWNDLGNPEAPYINYADMPQAHFEKLYFNAKLKVVLPLNLTYFLKDNIRHPLRLIYIASTQFKSVVTRAFKAAAELQKINKKTDKGIRVLFIAYHSVFYPIMESQGFSYIRGLSRKGVKYSLLTFEAKRALNDYPDSLTELKKAFRWRYLRYHQRPRFIATLWDVSRGIFATAFIIKKDKIKIIHARGLISALVAFLPAKILGAKFFFDTRGLLADKYVGGGLLKKDSSLYKLMKKGEDFLVKESDYFTVETHRHAEAIRDSGSGIQNKMEVIPCCVNLDKFNYSLYKNQAGPKEKEFNLVYLGKIGTWYLLDEMLDFFNVLSQEIINPCFTFLTEEEPKYIYSVAERKKMPLDRIIIKRSAEGGIVRALAQADAGIFFINPYKRYNSSPIKYGEYLACGLPVVINSGIGDTDSITEKEGVGVVIREFSEDNYRIASKKIINLLRDKDRLRQHCKDIAQKYFSLEEGIDKYLAIYQKLSTR